MIFTRKNQMSFMIGNDIEVIILASGQNFVKIGVNAPPEVAVHRTELFQKLMKQEGEAISFAGMNKASETRYCDCGGDLAPGLTCKWVNPNDNELCSYKGDEHCEHME